MKNVMNDVLGNIPIGTFFYVLIFGNFFILGLLMLLSFLSGVWFGRRNPKQMREPEPKFNRSLDEPRM